MTDPEGARAEAEPKALAGEWDAAAEPVNRRIPEGFHDDVPARNRLAKSLVVGGRVDESIGEYERVLDSDPPGPGSKFARAAGKSLLSWGSTRIPTATCSM